VAEQGKTMSKEAMTLALELFEQFGRDSRLKYEHQAIYKTIVALKEALAKQEQGEPVAWRIRCTDPMREWTLMYRYPKSEEQFSNIEIEPLYTTPQPAQKPWVGLTDEERFAVLFGKDGKVLDYEDYAEAIEAKLKEKNT
jgi:hypothetical protein